MAIKQRTSCMRTTLVSYFRKGKHQKSKTSTASKEHRIFHVTEILEAILHELPITDLLLVMRVCKTWKKTIDTSSNLQKSLFFLGEADPQRLQGDSTHGHSVQREIIRQVNPLLESFVKAALIEPKSLKGRKGVTPSRNQMLFTQPPVYHLTVSVYYHYTALISVNLSSIVLEHTGGIRFGDFLDLVKSGEGGRGLRFKAFRSSAASSWSVSLGTTEQDDYERIMAVELRKWAMADC